MKQLKGLEESEEIPSLYGGVRHSNVHGKMKKIKGWGRWPCRKQRLQKFIVFLGRAQIFVLGLGGPVVSFNTKHLVFPGTIFAPGLLCVVKSTGFGLGGSSGEFQYKTPRFSRNYFCSRSFVCKNNP